jgi:hypothetical protein
MNSELNSFGKMEGNKIERLFHLSLNHKDDVTMELKYVGEKPKSNQRKFHVWLFPFQHRRK